MIKRNDIIRECVKITPKEYRNIGDEGVAKAIAKTKSKAYNVAKSLKWKRFEEIEFHFPDYNLYDIATPSQINKSHKTVLPAMVYVYSIVLRKTK